MELASPPSRALIPPIQAAPPSNSFTSDRTQSVPKRISLVLTRDGRADFPNVSNVSVKPTPVPDETPIPNPNAIKTTRFTLKTWLPKSLKAQFQRAANIYFLLVAVLACTPLWDPPGTPKVIIVISILAVQAIKDLFEDWKRGKDDKAENTRTCHVYNISTRSVQESTWETCDVGTLVRVDRDEVFPADVFVVATADPSGQFFVSTKSLDGETNLKTKELPPGLVSNRGALATILGENVEQFALELDPPTQSLFDMGAELTLQHACTVKPGEMKIEYDDRGHVQHVILDGPARSVGIKKGDQVLKVSAGPFSKDAVLKADSSNCPYEVTIQGKPSPVSMENFALRGCVLENTAHVWGVVCFVSETTKVRLNATPPPSKSTELASFLNQFVTSILVIILLMSVYFSAHKTLDPVVFVKYLIILYPIVPMTLYIMFEVLHIVMGRLIDKDLNMKDPETDAHAQMRNTSILEELGQVDFMFSDKTGTLTANEMRFAACYVGTHYLGPFIRPDGFEDERKYAALQAALKQQVTAFDPEAETQMRELTIIIKDIFQGNIPVSVVRENTSRGVGGYVRVETPKITKLFFRKNDTVSKLKKFISEYVTGVKEVHNVRDAYGTVNGDSLLSSYKKLDASVQVSMASAEAVDFWGSESEVTQVTRRQEGYNANIPPNSIPQVSAFFEKLAICHEVNVGANGDGDYQGASPDEVALVQAAAKIGYTFCKRDVLAKQVHIETPELSQRVVREVLRVIPFSSDRKRMSVVCRESVNDSESRVLLITKGADSVMKDLLIEGLPEKEVEKLDEFALNGWRTLVIGCREMPFDEWDKWETERQQINERDKCDELKLLKLEARLEQKLSLLGITALEDRLQDGVPHTIALIRSANVRVWVLTGDKIETAVEIAKMAQLFVSGMEIKYIVRDGKDIQAQMDAAHGAHGMVVDGGSMASIFEDGSKRKLFYKLADKAKACIACRLSPMQKAELVALVRGMNPKAITLAIGDGANDVPMIQAAHVGVGIAGKEGSASVQASDVAIGQFRFVEYLLFDHGRKAYRRLATFLNFFVYKGIVLGCCYVLYARENGSTGQLTFANFLDDTYNAVTSVGISVLLLTDSDIPDNEVLLAKTRAYEDGPRRKYFNNRLFLIWVVFAIWHGFVAWGIPSFSYHYERQPELFWQSSFIAFTNVVIIVHLKALVVEASKLRVLGVLVVLLETLIYIPIIIVLSVMPKLSPKFHHVPWKSFVDPEKAGFNWCLILFVPTLSIVPDIVYEVCKWRRQRQAIAQDIST